jgi:hypothetical protein
MTITPRENLRGVIRRLKGTSTRRSARRWSRRTELHSTRRSPPRNPLPKSSGRMSQLPDSPPAEPHSVQSTKTNDRANER